jgi:phage N-6-adenine-methyltransferase
MKAKVIALPPRRMPSQKPGKSKQDYGTPPEFIAAVEARFGDLQVDLAASAGNAKASRFVAEKEDSLALDWSREFAGRRCWLNPPFGHLAPWAERCASYARAPTRGGVEVATAFPIVRGGVVFLLTPASIGSEWFARHVHGVALVLALRGRLSFDGVAPYPKDCILSVFGPAVLPGFDVWDWRGWW